MKKACSGWMDGIAVRLERGFLIAVRLYNKKGRDSLCDKSEELLIHRGRIKHSNRFYAKPNRINVFQTGKGNFFFFFFKQS